jgi:hypothetical protein
MAYTLFATKEDLELYWRSLEPSEVDRAELLLQSASDKITLYVEGLEGKIPDDPTDMVKRVLRDTCCDMVKRAMISSVGGAPLSQFSQTAGVYTESGTYVNPTGDLYLIATNKADLERMFQLSSVHVGTIEMAIHDSEGNVL